MNKSLRNLFFLITMTEGNALDTFFKIKEWVKNPSFLLFKLSNVIFYQCMLDQIKKHVVLAIAVL